MKVGMFIVIFALLAPQVFGQQTWDQLVTKWEEKLDSESAETRLDGLKDVYRYSPPHDAAILTGVFARMAKALDDRDPSVRAAAPRALHFLAEAAHKSRKEELLKMLEEGVAGHEVGYSLMELGNDAGEALPGLVDWADPNRLEGIFSIPTKNHYPVRVVIFVRELSEECLLHFSLHEDGRVRGLVSAELRRRYKESAGRASRYLSLTSKEYSDARRLGIEIYSQHNPRWEGQISRFKQLLEDEDPSVHAFAVRLLPQVNQRRSMLLLLMLESPSAHVRTAAVHEMTVEDFHDLGQHEFLIKGITDDDDGYALACLEAIGRFRVYSATAEVLSACENAEYPHRRAAIAAAGKLSPSSTVPVLVRLLHSDSEFHSAVLTTLAEIGPNAKAALPDLYSHFNPEDADGSAAVLDTIMKIDPSNSAARRVMAMYSDLLIQSEARPGRRRVKLCWRLLQHGPRAESVVPAVVCCLDASNSQVTRRSALRLLAELGPDARPAVPAVQKLLETEENEYLRELALTTLGQIE